MILKLTQAETRQEERGRLRETDWSQWVPKGSNLTRCADRKHVSRWPVLVALATTPANASRQNCKFALPGQHHERTCVGQVPRWEPPKLTSTA